MVWGGPNFPPDFPSQLNYFKKFPLDIYVPIEGEIGFSNIVERGLKVSSNSELRKIILNSTIPGCISRLNNGEIKTEFSENRIKNLDEIPSPYTTGLLDEFFDGKLSPMIQTNRGCPFSCTFCVDGSDSVNQINQFSTKRVDDELKYIAKIISYTNYPFICK